MKFGKSLKKVFGVLISLCMVLQYIPMTVLAEAAEELTEESIEETVTLECVPEVDLPENDELFQYFVEEQLYGYEMATFGTRARESLNDAEKALYDALKERIEAVARNGGSTVFALDNVDGLKTSWTHKELDVSRIDWDLVKSAFTSQFDLNDIMIALLADCPFDLYWYDKTLGVSMSYGGSYSSTQANIRNLTFAFTVSRDYRSATNVVTSNVAKVAIARRNAQAVVDANASKASIAKLTAYKDYICDEVSYNHSAANNNSTPYGDPWQLISVFDNDSKTNVVCEGYSKAFQYLCDLGGMDCISVSGVMAGGTGAGDHMWNVVTLNGKNYLVDVTNCDDGTAGAPDLLFLKGAAYRNGRYAFPCRNQTIYYTCEDLSLSLDTPTDEHIHNTNGEVIYENLDEANHLKMVACKDCPEDHVTESVEAHSTDAEGDKAATEQEPAYCSVCESYYGEPIPHVHNTDGEVTYENLDETNHLKMVACKDCPEDHVTESVEAHSTDAEGDKAATEQEPAYCSVCDGYYGESLPHVHNTDGEVTYAKLDETNHLKMVACKDCPEDYVTESVEAHSTDAEGDKAATEQEPAYCSLCESYYGEPIHVVIDNYGNIDCTVDDQAIIVNHAVACKVGYWNGNTYVAVAAIENADGTHTFAAPEGVKEFVLVVKGDVNGDGKVSLADSTRAKAYANRKISLSDLNLFAGNVNNDGKVTLADSTKIKAVANHKTSISW